MQGGQPTGEHALTVTADWWGLNALSQVHVTGCFRTHSVQGQPIKELVRMYVHWGYMAVV